MSGSPLLLGLEQLVNRYLALDPAQLDRFADLAGRCLALELEGLGWRVYLCLTRDGVHLTSRAPPVVDAEVSGPPFSLLRMLAVPDDPSLLLQGQVKVRGRSGLVERVRALLTGVDVDWEEQVSRLLGDIPAHQLGNLARDAGRWARRSTEILRQNGHEYLVEELRLVPHPDEVAGFNAAVDDLRDDVERLTLRVERLVRRLAERER
jgi:ubiquinone biosynthesis protein UbiJ